VDDIWEEEVLFLPNIEFNGLLTIVGNADIIQECIRVQGLPTCDYALTECVEIPVNSYMQTKQYSNGFEYNKPNRLAY
jgi:ABC-type antimicrobial peptide transport system ATPase subunit